MGCSKRIHAWLFEIQPVRIVFILLIPIRTPLICRLACNIGCFLVIACFSYFRIFAGCPFKNFWTLPVHITKSISLFTLRIRQIRSYSKFLSLFDGAFSMSWSDLSHFPLGYCCVFFLDLVQQNAETSNDHRIGNNRFLWNLCRVLFYIDHEVRLCSAFRDNHEQRHTK